MEERVYPEVWNNSSSLERIVERTTGCHKPRCWTNESLWSEVVRIGLGFGRNLEEEQTVMVQEEISVWLERRTSGSKS